MYHGENMNSKAIIGIVVVVVIIIAAAAAVVLLSGDDDDNDSTSSLPCKLRVLGNANQDNYLNSDDVQAIQDIIDGKAIWDRTANPLADANNDGIIDSNDISLVQRFINGQSATMYYLDWDDNVSSVTYPLSNVLGSSYGIYTEQTTGLDLAYILGIEDKVTYLANADIGPSDLDTTLYPTASSLKSVGIKTPNLQSLYADNVRILMGDVKFLYQYVSEAESAGFTVIKLPENRVKNGISSVDTLITLGVMFNAQDKTAPFITFMDKVNSKVSEAVTSAGVSTLSYLIPYNAPGYLPEIYVDAHGSGNVVMSDVYTLEMLPVKSAVTTTAADGFDLVTAQNLVALNPDMFVVSMFGYSTNKAYTYNDYVSAFKNFVELGFDKSTAGTNHRIYVMPFENTSLAGMASVLVLASMIWPDAFDSGEAWDMMYEYYSIFTHFSGSLDDLKSSKFAPLCYYDL